LVVDAQTDSEDGSSNLEIILIVLLCVMIPLILVLVFIVVLFRKNRTNAVATALLRR
jgi:heme/copper-type cytochrome/quinol oxidase subunit 2